MEENDFQQTDITSGLSTAEVDERIQAGKVNGEQTIHTKSVAQILKENILTFFNFVFVVLAIILSFFAFSDTTSKIGGIGNFGFLILIVFNTAAGIIQGLRSKFTMDKLSLLSAPKAIVVRDGEEKEIAIENIVLDDIMILSSGKQICADSVVVEGSIEVNESLITGEPDAILKTPGDKVMSGSFVVSGKAKCQVEHVAMDNFVMKISAGAKYFKRPSSEIWRSLMYVVKVMSIVIVPVGVALFLVKYLLQNIDLNETVITVIGTVIGMIPSGLVALATTVFCVSVIRLSKNNTLAQDLYCIETLARVDVLCLDKTGTITEGSMEVNDCLPTSIEENELKQLLKDFTSALNAEDATSVAIKNFVSDFEQKAEIGAIVPFSSARKWSGATLDNKSYVLGAPEFVFKTPQTEITEKTAEMAEKGYRVLVFASSDNAFDGQNLPDGLTLCGFVFITDKIRKEAPDTLAFFKKEGVNVKIISGDNPVTVRAVALRAGLENCDDIIDMSTLSTDEEIEKAAEKYTIFGRVLPDQKLALVKALKKHGHTVAMTGDGVNDVLALKEADCSIAMASGSDAAKNVSSLVLLDSNFASMPKVVAEGRRSINNLERSASLYIMKTIYNTLLAVLFLFIPNALPFEPRHLTIIGMVTIGIPSVIIALEPNHDIVKGHFLPKVLSNAISGSIVVLLGAVCILITYNCFLTELTDAQITNLYIVITTFVGLVYLFKVSLPFSWLHIVTLVLMIGLFVACYFVKLPFTIGNLDMTNIVQEFFGLSNNFTAEMAYAIVGIGGTLVAIYIALIFAMRNINKKGDDSVTCKFLRKKNVI